MKYKKDYYLKYIHEQKISQITILNMQRAKVMFLKKLYDSTKQDIGGNHPKTINLKNKLDASTKRYDSMKKSFDKKGETAKVSANVGQGVGKTTNDEEREATLAKQADAAGKVSDAISNAKSKYHTIMSKGAYTCYYDSDKHACIKAYKIHALQSAKAEISNAFSDCNNTKNPAKCLKKLQKKFNKYHKRLSRIR